MTLTPTEAYGEAKEGFFKRKAQQEAICGNPMEHPQGEFIPSGYVKIAMENGH